MIMRAMINRVPRSGKLAGLGLLALLALAACVVGGGGYGGDVDVGYVGGYYEPGGYDYGGWGPGYRVGPPRGGERGPGGGERGPGGGGGRGAPSIPHGSGGGGHGGGHGGGGGHGR
jgi:squid-like protein/heterogeneous nuclear ribonucleoprotein A1/A3